MHIFFEMHILFINIFLKTFCIHFTTAAHKRFQHTAVSLQVSTLYNAYQISEAVVRRQNIPFHKALINR